MENNKSYWLGAVFNSYKPSSLGDVSNIICNLEVSENGMYLKYTSKEQITNSSIFKKYFGNLTNNNYHPNEIVAEYMSLFYLNNGKLDLYNNNYWKNFIDIIII